jgi:predicted nucleotidyltransferase
MNRDSVLKTLAENRGRLTEYSVKSLAIFGSVARNEASDVDILVEFRENAHVGLFGFVRLQRFLGEILGCEVDLATPDALRKEFKDRILKEAIRAA